MSFPTGHNPTLAPNNPRQSLPVCDFGDAAVRTPRFPLRCRCVLRVALLSTQKVSDGWQPRTYQFLRHLSESDFSTKKPSGTFTATDTWSLSSAMQSSQMSASWEPHSRRGTFKVGPWILAKFVHVNVAIWFLSISRISLISHLHTLTLYCETCTSLWPDSNKEIVYIEIANIQTTGDNASIYKMRLQNETVLCQVPRSATGSR